MVAQSQNKELIRDYFRARLTEVMRDRGWNASELADHIGVDKSNVSSWMSGKNTVSLRSAKNIAKKLGMSVDDLLPPSAQPNALIREMTVDAVNPKEARLQIVGKVPTDMALKIFEMLANVK